MSKRNSPESIKLRKKKGIRHGRHCVFEIHTHLVFVTKYRRNVFKKRTLHRLKAIFIEVLFDFESELLEFDGEDDHVHLLIISPPKYSISKIVNSLKGVSARYLRQENYPEIQKKLWGTQLWSPSYYAGSCGGAPVSVIRQYIEQQKTPL